MSAHVVQDVKWTKALKYMLTDLKWCMSWVISRQEGGLGLHELQRSALDSAAAPSESHAAVPDAAVAAPGASRVLQR
jgi:hypothetical protein